MSKLYNDFVSELRMIDAENTHHIGIYLEQKDAIYKKQIGTRAYPEEEDLLLAEYNKFKQIRKNIEHAAANIIQNGFLKAINDYYLSVEKEAEEDCDSEYSYGRNYDQHEEQQKRINGYIDDICDVYGSGKSW